MIMWEKPTRNCTYHPPWIACHVWQNWSLQEVLQNVNDIHKVLSAQAYAVVTMVW